MGAKSGVRKEEIRVGFVRKPLLVLVMYSPRASTRGGSFQRELSGQTSKTSFSRTSRARLQAGQRRLACSKDSGWTLNWGQVVSGSWSNQEGCAVS